MDHSRDFIGDWLPDSISPWWNMEDVVAAIPKRFVRIYGPMLLVEDRRKKNKGIKNSYLSV